MNYPLSYKLNKAAAKQFIDASAPDARSAVRKFIKATTHISFEQFIGYINTNLREVVSFVPDGRPIFAYIDTLYSNYVTKSNYWIYTYIKSLAKNKYGKEVDFIESMDDSIVQDNDVILLIDDCIYSGNQMSDTIAAMANTQKKSVQIVLFVSFMSNDGLKLIIETKNTNRKIQNCAFTLPKHQYIIQPLSLYMTVDELVKVMKYYLVHYFKLGHVEQLDAVTSASKHELVKFPIYFDHKLADYLSSFPLIYSGLVPNKHNADILQKLHELKKEEHDMRMFKRKNISELQAKIVALEAEFIMYPLISHCDHIRKPEIARSTCPPPPYKDGYSEFIKMIKTKMRSHGPSKSRNAKSLTLSKSISSLSGTIRAKSSTLPKNGIRSLTISK